MESNLCAGVAQWQSVSLPSWLRGFDSHHPLHSNKIGTMYLQLSWIEHRPSKARVGGSNPSRYTKYGGCSAVGQSARLWILRSWVQAPPSTPQILTLGCRQAVRQQTLTLSFVGSNPATPAIFKQTHESLGCRQVVRHGTLTPTFEGSKPSTPAKFGRIYMVHQLSRRDALRRPFGEWSLASE